MGPFFSIRESAKCVCKRVLRCARQLRVRWIVPLLCAAGVFSHPVFGSISPAGPGTYEIGSSNFEVIENLPHPMLDYLQGTTGDLGVYISTILAHEESALVTDVRIPVDARLYGQLSGSRLPIAMCVFYPTRDNKRSDYAFPYTDTTDRVFPHMQRDGDAAIFPEKEKRYPLIVYSHGHRGHGLWELPHLKYLASHGYIVVCVFYGDGRMDTETALNFRPIALRTALDFVLSRPDFGPAIDDQRIGVSGGSLGGYTVLTALGGKCAVTLAPDSRIKAGFGLVPFMGISVHAADSSLELWPFEKDLSGLRSITAPFLAVYVENDVSAPPSTVLNGLSQMRGSAIGVALAGESHVVSDSALRDVFTWELLFFDAWLRGDRHARDLLYNSANVSVEGGADDRKTFQRPTSFGQ